MAIGWDWKTRSGKGAAGIGAAARPSWEDILDGREASASFRCHSDGVRTIMVQSARHAIAPLGGVPGGRCSLTPALSQGERETWSALRATFTVTPTPLSPDFEVTLRLTMTPGVLWAWFRYDAALRFAIPNTPLANKNRQRPPP